jgi:transcriptional regulator with XRE-family HTH domain
MEKDILGDKLKAMRTGKGYSQEYLAELSQISLRTVQRIENGETLARGDTLNRLAKALEINIAQLLEKQSEPIAGISNNSYIALMNLSGLGCLFVYFPFLGLLLPLVFWLIKKDRFSDVNESGKKILNFQFTWVILFLMWMVFVLFFVNKIAGSLSPDWGLGLPELILLSIYVFILFNIVMIIINTARILMLKEMKYWPAIRFLR